MSTNVRILLVDDHPVLRKGLIQVIEADPSLQVVGEAGDGEAALAQIEKLRPNIAVLDIAFAFARFHTVGNAVRNRRDRARTSVGEIIQRGSADPEDPAIAQHPEVAVIVFQNAGDEIIEQTVLGRHRSEAAIFEAIQSAAIRPEPKRTIRLFDDRADVVVGQPVPCRVVGELSVPEAAQAACRADPECAVTSLHHRTDVVADQAGAPVVDRERAVSPSVQSFHGSDPHVAIAILGERHHELTG